MKVFTAGLTSLTVIVAGILIGCSATATKSPDIAGDIRKSLDAANLKAVSVSQDTDKGVVTLAGTVPADKDKAQAEAIAKAMAGPQVVANQIAVIPPGFEKDAKTVNSDLDSGITSNLHAALLQAGLQDGVKYDVKNGVVTITGEVVSDTRRADVQTAASKVPNVQQVVNELQIKDRKASSSH